MGTKAYNAGLAESARCIEALTADSDSFEYLERRAGSVMREFVSAHQMGTSL